MKSAARINVVHVTQFLEIGGLESFIVEFCKLMDRDAFDVSVLCLNGYDEQYKAMLERQGVPVALMTKNGKYDWRFFGRVAAVLKAQKTDILHAHGGCFLYSAIIASLCGARMIYTAHGLPITSGVKATVEDVLALAFTDRFVAVSAEVADNFKRRTRLCGDRVQVIINGIDEGKFLPCTDSGQLAAWKRQFGLPEGRVMIGSVGRLEPVKNYPLLLRAFAEVVHGYGHDAHLVLVGSGSDEAALRRLAGELSIDSRVSFLGIQYDLPKIYPLFDIFALSSLTEGTSIALLEAQSCGVPAVVTDVGGNSTIIRDGENGYLCPFGDQAALAERLNRLINTPGELARMRPAARAVVLDRFTMASVIQQYQEIYCSFTGRIAPVGG